MSIFSQNKIYLDSASGAILNKNVFKKMQNLNIDKMGNPASNHYFGLNSKNILEESRSILAKTIEAHTDEIIFTSSGTESIALGILGTIYQSLDKIKIPHIITSTIEHSAVTNTCKMLEDMKLAEVSYIKPQNQTGLIDIDEIINNIKDNTVLISIHMVNSEIGVIQNIPELIKKLDKIKEQKYNLTKMRFSSKSYYPYLHIDACQAYAHLDLIPIKRQAVDMISFNSVKIGGPSGIGVLYKKRSVSIKNIYGGGDQELGLRPGTQSPILAYGFAEASKILKNNLIKNENKYNNLKEYFLNELYKISTEEKFSFIENSSKLSVPSIISISFPYFSGEQFTIELDARGIAVSSKSACNTENNKESIVIEEIRKASQDETLQQAGLVDDHKPSLLQNWGTIRISFSPDTKKIHINKLLKAIKNIVQTYRTVLY